MATPFPPHTPSSYGEQLSVQTVELDPGRAHVTVRGDVDLSTGAALWAVLRSHLSAGRRDLLLDLSGVTFMDVTALTGIAEVHREAVEHHGRLVLAGVHDPVARLLRLTGLDEMLTPPALDGPPDGREVGEPLYS